MPTIPAISILTPVWNGQPYIKECVESVLAQDFQDWEMIIGDNASDDGTSEYLRTLTDPRIKVFRHEKNLGVYKNIRFLYNKATAPIYTALCADDYFYEGGLRKIVDEWASVGPEIGLISFNWKHRQLKHDRTTAYSYSALPNVLDHTNATIAFFLFGNIPGNFSEVSARVPLVKSEDFIYDIKYSGDYEYWLRLTKKSAMYLSDTEVVYIRRHDRVMATYAITKGEYHEESLPVFEKIIDELSSKCDRGLLKAFYNMNNCSYHLRDAIKSALFGKFTALRSFIALKSNIFWSLQLIRVLPFALSERLRYAVVVPLAGRILAAYGIQNQPQKPIMQKFSTDTPAIASIRNEE
jgi:glycosyltransferase involved in cell wall biosynthesis